MLLSSVTRSGNLASGQVGWPHMASGAIRSGTLANASVLSGSIGSGQIASGHLASGLLANLSASLTSGSVGSGFLASGSVQGFFGATRHIASGTLGVFDFGSGAILAGQVGSGAILSGNIASGQIGGNHLANASVTSGDIASGQIGWPLIGNAGVLSGNIGSGIISSGMLASGLLANITGGSVTSGSIVTPNFASGAVAPFAEGIIQWLSGFSLTTVVTQETVSGVCAVNLSQSGNLQLAMASVSGRMPALGVVFDNVLSGSQATVFSDGNFQVPVLSGMSTYSGYTGQLLYVGRSGQIVTSSGSVNSGGLLSGDIVQPIGWATNGSGMSVSVTPQLPFVPGLIGSGQLASGVIDSTFLADGAVKSGDISSGQIGTSHISSGAEITNAVNIIWDPGPTTAELISGVRAVTLSTSGLLRIAMTNVSGRMPAIGVLFANVASGVQVSGQALFTNGGPFQVSSGLVNFTRLGRTVFVGRSGQLINVSGGWGSGGFVSGDFVQSMGFTVNSGALLVEVGPMLPRSLNILSGGADWLFI